MNTTATGSHYLAAYVLGAAWGAAIGSRIATNNGLDPRYGAAALGAIMGLFLFTGILTRYSARVAHAVGVLALVLSTWILLAGGIRKGMAALVVIATPLCLANAVRTLRGGSSAPLRRAEQHVHRLKRENAPLREVLAAVKVGLAIAEHTYGESSHPVVPWLRETGQLQRELADPQAVATLTRALRVARDTFGPDAFPTSCVLTDLAGVCRLLGRFDEAESYYREALSIDAQCEGEGDTATLTDMNNLALLLLDRANQTKGDLVEARSLLTRVREADARQLPSSHPHIAQDHLNWSGLLKMEGDWEGAEAELRRALLILTRFHPYRRIEIANLLHSLGNIIAEQGRLRLTEALDLFERALRLDCAELGSQHTSVAADLDAIGRILARLDQPRAGLRRFYEASLIGDEFISQALLVGSEWQARKVGERARKEMHVTLSLVHTYLPENGDGARQCFDLLLRRKGIELEALKFQQERQAATGDAEVSKRLSLLAEVRTRIAEIDLRGPEGTDILPTLAALQAERDRLESALAQRLSGIELQQALRDLSAERVAASLASGSALIEFVRLDVLDFDVVKAPSEQAAVRSQRYVAFVLSASAPRDVRMVDLGPASEIERSVQEFQEMLSSVAVAEAYGFTAPVAAAGIGIALREKVFDPLVPHLAGARRVLIAPDGVLSLLSFEALPAASGSGHVFDAYDVSYVGVGRDLLTTRPLSFPSATRPLVAANPDFNLVAHERVASRPDEQIATLIPDDPFAQLPGAEHEGRRVADLLNVEPWLGDRALKSHIRAAASPLVLHLATLACFYGRVFGAEPFDAGQGRRLMYDLIPALDPDTLALTRSFLVLAGANAFIQGIPRPSDAENGILTAEEVSSLDLRDTALVVLSACDSGIGNVRNGDGVYGLRRSFFLAGARSLVMSLWSVADNATQELMGEFYLRLKDGATVESALREARICVRQRYPQPFYWAAFVCAGDASMRIPIASNRA